MILSIVIVNYNVRCFLEQCLNSVYASKLELTAVGERLELEVFVVDNSSVDGSVEMVREKFPQVHLIANRDNPGFAKANNQALRMARGDYRLLLNPDTIVERDTFQKCVDFFLTHPDCGGLGVKMINGEGKYLKESKRGFPTPQTSFFKISGLIRLFPHHRKIAAYYMGHLSPDETNRIEILPGAFLMISRQAQEKVGLLDESYFMYGEDIDFSWRIRLAGFENYYLPSTRIIHYKGESTKKGSMNYVYTFYNAMVIFARRYFSNSNARLYIFLIQCAIWLRAALSWGKRIGQKVALPVADFLIGWDGFVAIKQLWATCWASNVNYYPSSYTFLVLPLYVLVLLLLSWLNGAYDKPFRPGRMTKGMAIGCAVLLVFYSLLDEGLRYSRAILLLGSIWTLLATLGLRGILSLCGSKSFPRKQDKHTRCLLVGSKDEYQRIVQLNQELGLLYHEIIPVADTSQLDEMIRVYHADEVLFCSRDMQAKEIISLMQSLSSHGVAYKIAPEEADYIIGTDIIHTREDLFTVELSTLVSPMNRRNKRLFDLFSSLLLLLLSPILLWFQRRRSLYYPHCLQVLAGRKSWVSPTPDKGIFTPSDILPNQSLDSERMNLHYSKKYKLSTDFAILWRNWRNI